MTCVLKSDQCYGGVGRRNSCTKVEGGGVHMNTFYFTILFRNCCASALGSTCCGTVLKVFRKCDRPNI